MGPRTARYSFIPNENEQIDTVITVAEDPRSVIHGVVKDEKGKYIKDAVVKLFREKDGEGHCDLKAITHTFTDECGQFLFGPLLPGKKYVIKVWVNDVRTGGNGENYESKDEWDGMGLDVSVKGAALQKPKQPVKESNYYR